MPQNIIAEIN